MRRGGSGDIGDALRRIADTAEMFRHVETMLEQCLLEHFYQALDPPQQPQEQLLARAIQALFFPEAGTAGRGGGAIGAGGASSGFMGPNAANAASMSASATNISVIGGVGIGSGSKRDAVAAKCFLSPKPAGRGGPCRGAIFWRRIQELSREHRDMAFTVPIEPRFPNLRKFLIMSENANKYLMRQQNPFLGTVETVGQLKVSGLERFQVDGSSLRFDSLEFLLFCFCWRLVENAEADRTARAGGQSLDIEQYVKLLHDYLRELLPGYGSSSRSFSGALVAGASTLIYGTGESNSSETTNRSGRQGSGAAGGLGRGARHEGPEPGLVFTYLMAELWFHRYVPIEFPHIHASMMNSSFTPPRAVLRCVLEVIKHICQMPYEADRDTLKQEVRVLQRPVFQLLVHCFKHAVDYTELDLAVQIWVDWVTMAQGFMKRNRSGMGYLSPRRYNYRQLDPMERQWVVDNYVFFYILPPYWLEATVNLARQAGISTVKDAVLHVNWGFQATMAADFVSQHCNSILDPHKEVGTNTSTSEWCKTEGVRKDATEQSAEAQERERNRLFQRIELTYRFDDVRHRLHRTDSRALKLQTDRNFTYLAKQLKPLLSDEQSIDMRKTLQKVLDLKGTAAASSEVGVRVLVDLVVLPTGEYQFGFTCDKDCVIRSILSPMDGQRRDVALDVGSRIVAIKWHTRPEEIKLQDGLPDRTPRKVLYDAKLNMQDDGCQQAELLVIPSEKHLISNRAIAMPQWLENDNFIPAVPLHQHYYDGLEPNGSQLGAAFDCCRIGWLLSQLSRALTTNTWLPLYGTLVVGLMHWAIGPVWAVSLGLAGAWLGAGTLALGLVSYIASTVGYEAHTSGEIDSAEGNILRNPGGARKRFVFDFSFLLQQPAILQYVMSWIPCLELIPCLQQVQPLVCVILNVVVRIILPAKLLSVLITQSSPVNGLFWYGLIVAVFLWLVNTQEAVQAPYRLASTTQIRSSAWGTRRQQNGSRRTTNFGSSSGGGYGWRGAAYDGWRGAYGSAADSLRNGISGFTGGGYTTFGGGHSFAANGGGNGFGATNIGGYNAGSGGAGTGFGNSNNFGGFGPITPQTRHA